MEKALREAQIQVRQKQEEVEEMTSYKTAMEQEMADLQVTLFEEAHEMVRSEKEARHRDNCLLRDAQSRADLLTEEVKALKALVADHVVKRDPVPESSASSPPTSPVEVEKGNVDSILFNEFMKWHLNPSLDDSTDYMKRVLSEDITPCLRFHPGTMKISSAILKTMVDNALIIEAIPPGSEAAPACRLSKVCDLSCASGAQVLTPRPTCRRNERAHIGSKCERREPRGVTRKLTSGSTSARRPVIVSSRSPIFIPTRGTLFR